MWWVHVIRWDEGGFIDKKRWEGPFASITRASEVACWWAENVTTEDFSQATYTYVVEEEA